MHRSLVSLSILIYMEPYKGTNCVFYHCIKACTNGKSLYEWLTIDTTCYSENM